ncbi:hypothetical protein BTO30_00960 [Domibacillus antri]|uniref:Flagellar biosynthesis protein FlaG n=1 Tax=Domibacillus antri TaxID=1714264 RepID=A0A1Q8Q9J9_9BACI|nr:flagellar protein FlaG [Domibacillus antri]OLN24019.1 hypothetical protein BTO30_00960 [Domibacillus antri]
MIERVGESVSPAVLKAGQMKKVIKSDVPKQEQAVEQQEQMTPLKEEAMAKFTEQINAFLLPTRTHVQFEYHDELKEYYVLVVDDTSKEVLREIPSKKLLDIYAAMNEFIGLFFDKKA